MAESRQGTAERGFSMTLGRLFDPADEGLLLAVCYGPDGAPAALCQYVPAPEIDGYSLDLMRRSEGEHPNGLIDFLIVCTIDHLRAEGRQGLGLNFATMRAVLADEVDGGRSMQLRNAGWRSGCPRPCRSSRCGASTRSSGCRGGLASASTTAARTCRRSPSLWLGRRRHRSARRGPVPEAPAAEPGAGGARR